MVIAGTYLVFSAMLLGHLTDAFHLAGHIPLSSKKSVFSCALMNFTTHTWYFLASVLDVFTFFFSVLYLCLFLLRDFILTYYIANFLYLPWIHRELFLKKNSLGAFLCVRRFAHCTRLRIWTLVFLNIVLPYLVCVFCVLFCFNLCFHIYQRVSSDVC